MALCEAVTAWPPVTDECGQVFAASRALSGFDLPAGGRCLEVGSAEFSWLSQAKTVWPSVRFVGIDWRKAGPVDGVEIVRGNVLTHDFAPESFDAAVSVSTIEHIGLGHYDHDPESVDGDSLAMHRIWSWLKPGGLFYFDVPWNPGASYAVLGSKFRCYDDAHHESRLRQQPWAEVWRGWFARERPMVAAITKPVTPLKAEHKQFYYCACVWQKV